MDASFVDAFGLAGLAFLLKKLVDWLKQVRGGDVNGAVTQVIVWSGGVGLFFLAAASKVFAAVEIGGVPFADLDWAAKVLAGLALGSTASVVFDKVGNTTNSKLTTLPTEIKN